EKPISVFVDCVTNQTGSFAASFGYTNDNASSFTIPAGGSGNSFSPAPADRGQPSTFAPGTHQNAVIVVNIPNATALTWSVTLAGQTRTATATSSFATKCSSPPPPTTTGTTGTTTTGTTGTTTTGTTRTTTTGTTGTTTTGTTGTTTGATSAATTAAAPASSVDVAITN